MSPGGQGGRPRKAPGLDGQINGVRGGYIKHGMYRFTSKALWVQHMQHDAQHQTAEKIESGNGQEFGNPGKPQKVGQNDSWVNHPIYVGTMPRGQSFYNLDSELPGGAGNPVSGKSDKAAQRGCASRRHRTTIRETRGADLLRFSVMPTNIETRAARFAAPNTFAEWQTFARNVNETAQRLKASRDAEAWKIAAAVGIPRDGCCLHNASIDDGMRGWCAGAGGRERLKAAKRANYILNDWRAHQLAEAIIRRAWDRVQQFDRRAAA